MQKVNYEHIDSQLEIDEQSDYRFQERRHEPWKETYELFRDTVITNRLTQRQSVNIPLMKGTIKTILANIDEFPAVEFEELGNDKQKELFFNEYWQHTVAKDKMEVKDIVDKKQELLYGKTWTKLNIRYGQFVTEILEPYDVLVDRYGDPSDLETSHHLIEPNIFRTLDQLYANPNYDKSAVNRLRIFYASQQGLIKAEELTQLLQAKNQRLSDMGVPDINNPILGHTVVQLKAKMVKVWDEKDQEEHIHVIVKCDHEILMAKPLKEMLNIDFYPLITWSSDPERNDHYPDGTGDTVRTPNKILNVWFSQLAENRTLRNMGMNFYDATAKEGWVPETFEAIPFGWYPLPGKPSEILQRVEIPDLTESLDEMAFIKNLVESSTAATAQKKGESENGKVTLGEVELITKAATERITSISKFYNLAQKEKAEKFAKIVNANPDKLDAVKLYKKSHRGNWFNKKVNPQDWRSDHGYTARIISSTEREENSIKTLQKLRAVQIDFQGNAALMKITQKKELEFAGLNPDEIKEVMDYQVQNPTPMITPQGTSIPQLTPPQNVSTPQLA